MVAPDPLSNEIEFARRSAGAVFCARTRWRFDRFDFLRTIVGVLSGSDREEATEPLFARHARAELWDCGLQPDVQVLPEP